ncbi:MAG: septum formation initiator family protein [Bacteroidales bacterium]|nr:septum formation initiator family protein [Bacteroidales bacterium]
MDKGQKSKIALLNKYIIATVLFLAWIVFFDENSMVAHQKNMNRLKELQVQKEYYIDHITNDRKKLEDLSSGMNQLEKFAREQFYLCKPDEDVFIIVEEK